MDFRRRIPRQVLEVRSAEVQPVIRRLRLYMNRRCRREVLAAATVRLHRDIRRHRRATAHLARITGNLKSIKVFEYIILMFSFSPTSPSYSPTRYFVFLSFYFQ